MSKLTSLQQVHKHCINCDISHTAYYSQASGEAQYTTDIPTQPAELAAAFALTTKVRHYAQTAHVSFNEKEREEKERKNSSCITLYCSNLGNALQ